MTAKPRLLIVGRTRYRLPLDETLERKFVALAGTLDVRVVGTAQPGSPLADSMFRLVPRRRPSFLDGALFYVSLPRLIAAELDRFRPDVVLTQSAYEAGAALIAKTLARSGARVVVDVHGDWDTATRTHYGLADVRELDRAWRSWHKVVADARPSRPATDDVIVRAQSGSEPEGQ